MRKISKGSNTNEVSSTNLFGVIDDILNLSAERVRNFSINLDVSAVSPDSIVMANFTHLSQVLINLLNNGIDELQKCPPEARNIWISTEENGDEILLKVKDSGLGIPAEIREKIFQPFYTTKEVGKGTGLGLSISKSLMNEMGGDLYLSPDTSSTCFILKFNRA
jgi:C4-dicarboxylate-specific signal transduction histidine kinase